jgi:hypothetical protein
MMQTLKGTKGGRVLAVILIFSLSVVGLIGISSQSALAGTLANLSWAVSNNAAGATAVNYSYSFKTATAGIIKSITFTLSGGTLAGTPTIVANYGIGAGTVTMTSPTITYTVTSAVNIPVGIPIFIEFGGLTNPAAATYTTLITTKTSVPATIDSGTTPGVTFAATNTAKSIVVAPSLTFTLDTTSFQLNMDPSLPALADQSYISNLTVLTNANSGYTLTVANTAAGLQAAETGNPTIPPVATSGTYVAWPSPPAHATGYTVSGTGATITAGFASGTAYTGYTNAGLQIAIHTTSTGATADTIAVTDHTAIDYATRTGTYTDTITYTCTPNYN